MMSQAARNCSQHAAPRPVQARADAFAPIRAALDMALRWWRVGRHYHPERRYMRGGRRDATSAVMGR
ncbi:MAG TPA: hypothetical protein VNR89_24360 [Roseomonas sp.]|nr:hypothetical protein [Roseomonas sp.]